MNPMSRLHSEFHLYLHKTSNHLPYLCWGEVHFLEMYKTCTDEDPPLEDMNRISGIPTIPVAYFSKVCQDFGDFFVWVAFTHKNGPCLVLFNAESCVLYRCYEPFAFLDHLIYLGEKADARKCMPLIFRLFSPPPPIVDFTNFEMQYWKEPDEIQGLRPLNSEHPERHWVHSKGTGYK